jgi:hypothetical protein
MFMASFEVTKLLACSWPILRRKLLTRLQQKLLCAGSEDKSVFFYHDNWQKSKDSTE